MNNTEVINGQWYLKAASKKTGTYTRVKLPQYCVDIIHRNRVGKKIFPTFSINHLGEMIKLLALKAGWDEEFPKTRSRQGKMVVVYKNQSKKAHYRFCDLVSTHTMRRTAITTMLSLGMKEDVVRRISGHGSGSREFYKYVNYAQSYLDAQVEDMHSKLQSLNY